MSSDEPSDHWFISKIEKEYIIRETNRIIRSKKQVNVYRSIFYLELKNNIFANSLRRGSSYLEVKPV